MLSAALTDRRKAQKCRQEEPQDIEAILQKAAAEVAMQRGSMAGAEDAESEKAPPTLVATTSDGHWNHLESIAQWNSQALLASHMLFSQDETDETSSFMNL